MPLSLSLLFPILLVAAFFVSVVRAVFYQPRYRCLEDVILFMRKLGAAELDALTDAGKEWGLRNLVSLHEFRTVQRERYRLAYEYLKRLAHNAAVIQAWGSEMYETIRFKSREAMTAQDLLVEEIVELSTELRLHSMVALVRITIWIVLQMHCWPLKWTPRLSDLRVIGGIDMVRKYQQLIQVTSTLARTYGEKYSDAIIATL